MKKEETSKTLRSKNGRYKKKKYFSYIVGLLFSGVISILVFHFFSPQIYSMIDDLKNVGSNTPTTVFIENPSYELSLVADDINMYDYLSPSTRQVILDSLYSANVRFKVPIGLMHAITRTESEYRFWIDHPTVTTKIYGKMITTNAIGMGGVIWEIWGDTLKYFNVAYNKSDLYLPGVGITAQACVLNLIIAEVMRENTPVINIVARIQTKYYGASAKSYIARMRLVTSDLWIKRIAKEINFTYRIEEEVIEDSLNIMANKLLERNLNSVSY